MVRLASKLTLLISSLFLFGCEDAQQKNMGTQNMGTLLGSEIHKARATYSHP
ncbi:attH component of AttEFGH ABC transport system [Vibrio sp. JCM 19053]|nr:attH component of AttEFGH ABC transport system [Vibrio sp. JCM 19053]